MKTSFAILISSFLFFAFTNNPPIEINKILKSGDGKTIETAYKVETVQEEYDVLKHLKLQSKMQKLHIKDGYFYDEIKTQTRTIFFKIITKQLPYKIVKRTL